MGCVQDQAAQNYATSENYPSSPPSGVTPCKEDRAPPAYVLDVGQWLADPEGYYIGLVSGSTMAICRIMHSTKAKLIVPENKLINDVILALEKDGLSPSIMVRKTAKPWFDYERAYPDEILTSKDVLLVFVPDCHVGLRDGGDMFSPERALDSCNHLIKTITTIRTATNGKAKIIQLGDFLEVWETEASPGIYYEWTGPQEAYVDEGGYQRPLDANDVFMGTTGTIRYRMIPEQTVLIDRKERSERAVRTVKALWDYTPFAKEPKLFDIMIAGNHDAERKWTKAQFYNLGEFNPCDRVRTGRRGSVVFEHGHIFDEYNDTRDATDSENIMPLVRGKSVTYHYGRSKFSRGWQVPNPKDPEDENGGWLEDAWPSVAQWIGAVDVAGEVVIVGSARKYTFQLFRENIIANGTRKPERFDSPESYFVPVRLWVHAHTHVASLRSFVLDKTAFNRLGGNESKYQGFNSWPSVLNVPGVIQWG